MAAVKTVANVTQAMKGTPATAATGSVRLAWTTYAMPVPTIAAAATVLAGKFLLPKKSLLQPPIAATFPASNAREVVRAGDDGRRNSRYAAAAKPVSISVQAIGIATSGGLKFGCLSSRYQRKIRG